MKRILLPLLLLASVPALGQQTQSQPPTFTLSSPESSRNASVLLLNDSSANCEESILHASFSRPARFMLVAASNEHKTAPPTLSVQVANHSTKPVQAIDLVARLRIKENRYQLDSVTRDIPLHLSIGNGTQQLQLAESAMSFVSLSIDQVTYADGTTWKPERHTCGYQPSGSILVAK